MARTEPHLKLERLRSPEKAENHATSNLHFCGELTHLAHVPARVCELRPPEAEDPVDGLGAVDDLEAAVGGEERVAVREEAEVTLPHEGDLKHRDRIRSSGHSNKDCLRLRELSVLP